MNQPHAALYARVSSEQQAQAGTIRSQLAEIEDRAKADAVDVADELRFVDEGFSGGTLLRPALERLRDQVAAGTLDRVYVHSPDRLARKHAYQVLLVDEFHRAGVEIVFLNRDLGDSPEDKLLLQVQGVMAEYERAKILERSRRGKRHAARSGSVQVFAGAPYGFRYVTKQEGGGEARWDLVLEEARVVQRIFEWIGAERSTIGEVCRRLHAEGVRTRFGKEHWDRATVWGMLKNPAYRGQAAFGKTRSGPARRRLRPQRGSPAFARSGTSTYAVEPEDWIFVSVPRVVSDALFDAVQEQLAENRRRARKRVDGPLTLLQGLVVCKRCGYAYYGKRVSRKSAKGKRRDYAYYRCVGTDAYRFGGVRVCENKQIRTDMLDGAVWEKVRELLNNPSRLEAEYERRAREREAGPTKQALGQLQSRIATLRRGTARLIDGYAEGLIEKAEFEPRIRDRKARLARLEKESESLEADEATLQQLRLVVGRLEEFAQQIEDGLDSMAAEKRQELIRTLVKHVEVDESEVTVTFRVNPDPFDGAPGRGRLQRCLRRREVDVGRKATQQRAAGVFAICGQVELPILGQPGGQDLEHLAGQLRPLAVLSLRAAFGQAVEPEEQRYRHAALLVPGIGNPDREHHPVVAEGEHLSASGVGPGEISALGHCRASILPSATRDRLGSHKDTFRDPVTQPAHSLSTLRSANRLNTTQDSLPAGGQPSPGGSGYPPGSNARCQDDQVIDPPRSGLAWRTLVRCL